MKVSQSLFVLASLLALPAVNAQESQGKQGPSGIAMLREVEQRVLPLPLVHGVPRNTSLTDYYWQANVALHSRLQEAVREFDLANQGSSLRPFRAMTIISGPAGIGKTFIKRNVYQDSCPPEQIWKFDIRDVFAELAERGLAERKPDVHLGQQVINRLLSLTPAGRDEFKRWLHQRSAAFVVIDSLDEVHGDDSLFVLNELQDLALNTDRNFVHVVVFGRPLAFRDFWQQRHQAGIPDGLRGYTLNPPDFRTTGDLVVSSWNFDCWKHGLSRTDHGGESRPMQLTEYQKWSECEFDTSGEFADVSSRAKQSTHSDTHSPLLRWATQHRVFMAVLPNLAGNSMAREIVEQHSEFGQDFDERKFMDAFFDKWLQRDTKSGNRPSHLKPEHLELYIQLLESVAAKYSDEKVLGPHGYFDVAADDHVDLLYAGSSVHVPVRTLLDRSGLVTSDPMRPEATRYRFEPVWFHRLLLQRHQERQDRSVSNTKLTQSSDSIPR